MFTSVGYGPQWLSTIENNLEIDTLTTSKRCVPLPKYNTFGNTVF